MPAHRRAYIVKNTELFEPLSFLDLSLCQRACHLHVITCHRCFFASLVNFPDNMLVLALLKDMLCHK